MKKTLIALVLVIFSIHSQAQIVYDLNLSLDKLETKNKQSKNNSILMFGMGIVSIALGAVHYDQGYAGMQNRELPLYMFGGIGISFNIAAVTNYIAGAVRYRKQIRQNKSNEPTWKSGQKQ